MSPGIGFDDRERRDAAAAPGSAPRAGRATRRRFDGARPHAAAAVLAVAAAAPTHGQIERAPAFAGDDLTALPTDAWATNGGDWYNRRYSPLTEIDRGNVANLRGVWRTRLRGSGLGPQYSGEAQPLYYAGVLYVSTAANDVFAVDVDSGSIIWAYSANLDPDNDSVCCGWTSRGVALGEGRIYAGQLDGKLVALDQRTGDVVWSVQAERAEAGFSITSAPLYYDGLVVTGFAGAELGVRGRVKAFDADDGSLVWTFYTVPGPGEHGHDTWPADNEIWQHGGATVWQTPAVDPALGLIYFSTANPGPDFNGAVRAGDNLFANSIVAVDAATGEYCWHFQQVHHDLWDFDSAAPVVLFDVEIGGVERNGIAQASKTGWVYILDRTNGEPLIGIDERPVAQEPKQATSPTQPHPVGDAFVPQSIPITPEGFDPVNGGRIFTPFWTDYVIAKPGIIGGVNWPPAAYDDARNRIYVCAVDQASVYRAWEIGDERPPEGQQYIGGNFGTNPLPGFGIAAAIDVTTNRLVWQRLWTDSCYSGMTATAGGLVFAGRNDGRLTALDADSGRLLWEFQTGAGMNAPVTVFEHRGMQHVAAFSAGNVFAGSVRGDSLWLFSLDGELEPVAPGDAASATSGAAAPARTEELADAARGRIVYDRSCVFCHGADGTGGHGAPGFSAGLDAAAIRRIVGEGRNTMPAFGDTLAAAQIADVTALIVEMLAEGSE